MGWLKAILELLSSFFKWRSNVTDPFDVAEVEYRKRYEEWWQEFRRLEDVETKAQNAWRMCVTGHSDGNVDQLRTEYLTASAALGHHRARQPKRIVSGPE